MNKHWNYANRWLGQTPERALDIAYNAVINIKALEAKYFSGQKVLLPSNYSKNGASYLQSELNKCLRIAQTRLIEFKFSSFIFRTFGHFGLPESKNVIFIFIATFPVILDSIFKYWIFRYLNQTSPSAVATYRNMNE